MKRITLFLLALTSAILAFSQNIESHSKQRPLYMDLIGLERCDGERDSICIEIFRRKHSKTVNYNTSVLALILDRYGKWRGEIVRYSYKIADSVHIQNVNKQKIEFSQSWDKTWEKICRKKYHKMPDINSFIRKNKQINVLFGDGSFYVGYYYDRFGHHEIDCTEPQFYLDFCNERGIPCKPIRRFLEYMKIMDSEFSFDIP
jgi:hypothetical protein